jgi:uncharacterized protein (TIGR00299 family) protein
MERIKSHHNMTSIAYFDCPTGISGDMCLGALVHAGVPLAYLEEQLQKLGLGDEYHLWAETVQRQGQVATQVHVDLRKEPGESEHHHHHAEHRHLPEIIHLIQGADIPQRAKQWSVQIFQQLAIAEGKVHGIAPEAVHFHEVGAVDAIVDIVGTCLGLDYLNLDKIYSSALPTGGGTVWAAHGRLPVPVPAVLKLWETRPVPIYSHGIEQELVTPTGAAILVTLAESFGPVPPMQLKTMGLGAGSKDFSTANILRLWLGESETIFPENLEASLGKQETIAVLETQCDDLNPQAIGYLFSQLFELGALDVFTTAIAMKKSRPGVLLTVICHPDKVIPCQNLIFRETTTLGIRLSQQTRSILNRQFHSIQTPYGVVSLKVAYDQAGNLLNIQPEFEDCAQLARQHHQPWQTIHQAAIAVWYNQN